MPRAQTVEQCLGKGTSVHQFLGQELQASLKLTLEFSVTTLLLLETVTKRDAETNSTHPDKKGQRH